MPQDRLAFAVEAARRAGATTLEHFGSRIHDADTKGDGSPVTVADRNAENVLREMIAGSYPDDAIEGEEFGTTPGDSGWTWVLDPIDGTLSFVHGVPLFGTLVACLRDGVSTVGVIHMPALHETVYGAVGCGAWHRVGDREAVPTRVSAIETLASACVCTTGAEYFLQTHDKSALHRVHTHAGLVRGWSDCSAHVLLATGRIDAVIEPSVHVWDVAHLPAILGECGGRYSAWSGGSDIRDPRGIATNGHLHDELLGLVG